MTKHEPTISPFEVFTKLRAAGKTDGSPEDLGDPNFLYALTSSAPFMDEADIPIAVTRENPEEDAYWPEGEYGEEVEEIHWWVEV